MNYRLLLASCALLGAAPLLRSAETVYQSPVPPGGNRAAVAAPRGDWESMVQGKFDRYGNKHADIVFDGDSITNRWETTGRDVWKQRYEGKAADFGIEGDRVENVLWRLSKGQLDGVDPKVVVLMIGTNNVSRQDSAENIAAGIKVLVDQYLEAAPHAHLVLMGIFPRGKDTQDRGRLEAAKINQILSGYAGDRVSYVDLASKFLEPDGSFSPDVMSADFIHPNAKAYVIWDAAIAPLVEQYSK